MKKIQFYLGFIISGLFLFQSIELYGQENKIRLFYDARGKNKEYYDDGLKLYIGITGGINYSNFALKYKDNFNNTSYLDREGKNSIKMTSIENIGGPEAKIGLILRYRLNDYVSLESGITINFPIGGQKFGQRLNYHFDDNSSLIRMQKNTGEISSNFKATELPLQAKLYSDHKYFGQFSEETYKFYLFTGVSYITNYKSKVHKNDINNYSTYIPSMTFKNSYFMFNGGVGFSVYTKYTKFSIQANYHENITENLLNFKEFNKIQSTLISNGQNFPNPYMDAISKLGTRGWKLSIILE